MPGLVKPNLYECRQSGIATIRYAVDRMRGMHAAVNTWSGVCSGSGHQPDPASNDPAFSACLRVTIRSAVSAPLASLTLNKVGHALRQPAFLGQQSRENLVLSRPAEPPFAQERSVRRALRRLVLPASAVGGAEQPASQPGRQDRYGGHDRHRRRSVAGPRLPAVGHKPARHRLRTV